MKLPLVADCRETRESLSDLADGEIEPRRRRRIGRHLALCRGCRAVWQALQATIVGLRELGSVAPEPRPALGEAVVRRIRDDERRAGGG